MRSSDIQPQYFPRLHYFARALNSDVFTLRDDVQFVRSHKYPDGRNDKSYQVHSPIKQSVGAYFLTVPTKHDGLKPIDQTRISYDHKWIGGHLNTLKSTYSKSNNFITLYSEIKQIINTEYETLSQLNTATFFWGILHLIFGEQKVTPDMLNIEFVNKKLKEQNLFRLKQIRIGSPSRALRNSKNMSATEKIIALCKEVGATEDYCGGTGAAAYMDEKLYKKNGIKITVQDWKCREYPQLFTKQQGFIPNLSIIDLLMNVSTEEAVKVIKG